MDTLPTEGNAGFTETGVQPLTLIDAVMETSISSGVPQIRLKFKTDGGAEIHEFYQDSEKQFMMFKLGRALEALEIKLAGNIELRDVHKLFVASVGKRIAGHLVKNDKGYGAIDYSNASGGYGLEPYHVHFATEESEATPTAETPESLQQTAQGLNIAEDTTSAFAGSAPNGTPEAAAGTPEPNFTNDDF